MKKKPTIAIEADKEVLAGINSGELDRFKALIQQKIQQNVNNQLCGLDRIELEFEISLMPTGDLLGEPKMTNQVKLQVVMLQLKEQYFNLSHFLFLKIKNYLND